MWVSFKGRTLAFQADNVGSIPSTHSKLIIYKNYYIIVMKGSINMKRKRKFYFKKIITIIDYEIGENILDTTYEYKTLSNASIITQVINLLNKNKIDFNNLKDCFFDDYDYCWIEIKSTKEEYFRFVIDFINVFDRHMSDYKFYNMKE